MRIVYSLLLCCFLGSCSSQSPTEFIEEPLGYEGSFRGRDVYQISNPEGLRAVNRIWFHAEETQQFIGLRVECPDSSLIAITDVAIFELPDSVSVFEWIGLRNTDYGNWAYQLDPVRSELMSGQAQVQVVEHGIMKHHYFTLDEEYFAFAFNVTFDDLHFENEFRVRSYVSDRFQCYPSGEYWGGTAF